MEQLINSIQVINALVFSYLGGMHLYWAIGGQWATEAVIPTKVDGSRTFEPGKIGTLLVAICLFFAAYIAVANRWSWLYLAIGVVFGMRAIGDFNYVGLFKKIKTTHFGKMDSRYFVPLCLYIMGSHLFLYFMTN